MYENSLQQDMFEGLPLPENSGWKNEDDTFKIDWNSADLQDKVKGTIEFLTKGCSCKHGCKTRQCGCRKKSQHCGPGCECHGRVNLAVHADSDANAHTESDCESEYSSEDGSSTEEGSDSELETEIVTNMDDMDDIFDENFRLL